ncbi:hypothetical protein IFR04_000908 [Cadophora malorum]|uniref:Protein kinase domain-containing protein n=1 Tax=Cadophora malorum TaxID=108018 RepID=A0A8H8BW65_9HELO|nr:hypothetical protein IFR04_000908 [Cadophora malorum]
MVTLDPPIPLPQGNVQVLPDPKTTTEGDVLLTWNTGQARTEAPTNYLTTGKRKASSTDIWRLPVDNLANLPITEDNSRASISMAQQRPNLEVGNSGSALGGSGETYGRYVPGAPYSAKLRRLVYRCLSRQPDLRPKPRALVAEIQADLNGAAPAAAASTAEAANIGLAIPVVVPPALIIRPEPDSSVSSRVTKFSV